MDDYEMEPPLDHGYWRVNIEACLAIWARTDLSANAKLIYCYLLYRQGLNEHVWVGRETMMRETGMARSTLGDALKELLDTKGWDDEPLMVNDGQHGGNGQMVRRISLQPKLPSDR